MLLLSLNCCLFSLLESIIFLVCLSLLIFLIFSHSLPLFICSVAFVQPRSNKVNSSTQGSFSVQSSESPGQSLESPDIVIYQAPERQPSVAMVSIELQTDTEDSQGQPVPTGSLGWLAATQTMPPQPDPEPVDFSEIDSKIETLEKRIDTVESEHGHRFDSVEQQLSDLRDIAINAPLDDDLDHEVSPRMEPQEVPREAVTYDTPPSDAGDDRYSELEHQLNRKASELKHLHQRVKLTNNELNRQMGETRDKLKNFEEQLQDLSEHIDSIRSSDSGVAVSVSVGC